MAEKKAEMASTPELMLRVTADIAAARAALERLEQQVKDFGRKPRDKAEG